MQFFQFPEKNHPSDLSKAEIFAGLHYSFGTRFSPQGTSLNL